MSTEDLTTQALALPVDQRATLADKLLRSLNHPDSEIDKAWTAVARERLSAIRDGSAESVPAESVFKHMDERLEAASEAYYP